MPAPPDDRSDKGQRQRCLRCARRMAGSSDGRRADRRRGRARAAGRSGEPHRRREEAQRRRDSRRRGQIQSKCSRCSPRIGVRVGTVLCSQRARTETGAWPNSGMSITRFDSTPAPKNAARARVKWRSAVATSLRPEVEVSPRSITSCQSGRMKNGRPDVDIF